MTTAIQQLPLSPAFTIPAYTLSQGERTQLSLERAKLVARAYALTEDDVKTLSPAYWNLQIDPILTLDVASCTHLTIQLNLAVGTLTSYVDAQPYLRPLIRRLLRFEMIGLFCLTEIDHGLDAISIETTATVLSDGGFQLHTPHLGAAKFMPPSKPCGTPSVAIVFARLLVHGNDHGVRPFLVSLTGGKNMCSGVTSRILPPRGGSKPVNHCITTFNRVKLPSTALLGELSSSKNSRTDFLQSIWRVAVGSLSLSSIGIPSMQMAAYIAGRYSQRRTVSSPLGGKVPLISFRTQHGPILTVLAQSFVLKAFWKFATQFFSDQSQEWPVRHGISTIMKAISMQHAQAANLALSERCGAQGLFEHNQISMQHSELRGVSIAEGDLLVLSIRLASELLLGRYTMPVSTHPASLLAKHEDGLLRETRQIMSERMKHHRSDESNRLVLPRSEKIVQSIGHRMAYDAAVDAGLDARITDLYLASTVRLDEAWYSENAGISQAMQFDAEDRALQTALPLLDGWLDMTEMEGYVRAPIVSEVKWKEFVEDLSIIGDVAIPENSDSAPVRAHL